jgi:hypothetical protein
MPIGKISLIVISVFIVLRIDFLLVKWGPWTGNPFVGFFCGFIRVGSVGLVAWGVNMVVSTVCMIVGYLKETMPWQSLFFQPI